MTTETRLSDTLIELDGVVRIERGPKLLEAVATLELLADDVTAPHYKAPVQFPGFAVHARDALNKPIELGEPMAYLDWLGDWHWYVYALAQEPMRDAAGVVIVGDGQPVILDVWKEVATLDGDEAEALELARTFL